MKHFTNSYSDMTTAQQRQIKLAYLRSQFFLPPEILLSIDFSIDPILVLSGADAFEYLEDVHLDTLDTTQRLVITGDFQYDLIGEADQIGISTRLDKATGDCYIVYKLWFPFTKSNKSNKSNKSKSKITDPATH